MLKTKLRQVGDSVMLAVPSTLLEQLQLGVGAEVGLALEEGRLVVEAQPRKRYTLKQLIAQCDPAAPLTEEDQDWLAADAVGRELP